MRFILAAMLTLCAPARVGAQAAPQTQATTPATTETAVSLDKEPHHHLVLENSFMRAYYVEIPGHQATLLHRHDFPFVDVALGPADVMSDVIGKPEAHLTLNDGQAFYSPGGFSHVIRTDAGMQFRDFTVELLRPQAKPRNRCVTVLANEPLGECPQHNPGVASQPPPLYSIKPIFETDEILVESGVIAAGGSYMQPANRPARLLLVLDQSTLSMDEVGKPEKELHTGDVLWIPAGATPTFRNATAFQTCAFELIAFKDSLPGS